MSESTIPASLRSNIESIRELAATAGGSANAPPIDPQSLQATLEAAVQQSSGEVQRLANSVRDEVKSKMEPVRRHIEAVRAAKAASAADEARSDQLRAHAVEFSRQLSDHSKAVAKVAEDNAERARKVFADFESQASKPDHTAPTLPAESTQPPPGLSWSEFLDTSSAGLASPSAPAPTPIGEKSTDTTIEKPGPGGVGWSTYLDQ